MVFDMKRVESDLFITSMCVFRNTWSYISSCFVQLPELFEHFKTKDLPRKKFAETNLLQLISRKMLFFGEPLVDIKNHWSQWQLPSRANISNFLPIIEVSGCSQQVGQDIVKLTKGKVIIFNNHRYHDVVRKEYVDRVGTERDVASLETVFKSFNCDVMVRNDLTADDLKTCVKELLKEDYTDYDYLVVCVLSHGLQADAIVCVDGKHIDLREDIVYPFSDDYKCKGLSKKLKLFLVQACRGEKAQIPALRVFKDNRVSSCSPSIKVRCHTVQYVL